jgi:hypothetical protein
MMLLTENYEPYCSQLFWYMKRNEKSGEIYYNNSISFIMGGNLDKNDRISISR